MPRVLVGELMDDPALGAHAHERALRGLARLNRASRAAAAFWRPLRALARRATGPLTVVDVATGSADVPVALLTRAARAGVAMDVLACDLSPVALEAAQERANRAGVTLRTRRLDALADGLPRADVLLCSLFLHHLRDADAVALLARMADAARLGVVVGDLRRGAWGTTLATIAPRLLTRSRVVHVDAVRSARAALSVGEVRSMTRDIAGGGWRVERRWPARMLIAWTRDGEEASIG